MSHLRCPLAAIVVLLALTLELGPARALDEYQVLGPVQRNNLSVFFVRGSDFGVPALLTLEEAADHGTIKIFGQQNGHVGVENFSDQTIYVPFGTLLKGGLQDQVVSQDAVLKPRSGRTFLPVFCVDPFRSTGRIGEDSATFQPTGNLFPWLNARLSMLAGSESAKARQVRQMGVWWSVDALRAKLSGNIGTPLEPPLSASWAIADESALRSRHSQWLSSLVLSLENATLAQRLEPYLDILSTPDANYGGIIGVVFAINGRIIDAEMYRSHQLFLSMWPTLLRAYSIEALARGTAIGEAPPTLSVAQDFLHSAQQVEENSGRKEPQFITRESATAISTEITDPAGAWIHRGYIAKSKDLSDADTPDALAVSILESGRVGDRPIWELGYGESVILNDANAEHLWRAVIVRNNIESARIRLLNTSLDQDLNLANIFSAEMLSTDNRGTSVEVNLRDGPWFNRIGVFERVALKAAGVLLASLPGVLLWHTRNHIFPFIKEQTAGVIFAVLHSFVVLASTATLVVTISYISLRQLFAGVGSQFRRLPLYPEIDTALAFSVRPRRELASEICTGR